MGQYYNACLIDNKTNRVISYACPHSFGNGAKLMEHSWFKNNFVRFIEQVLIDKPSHLVWAGDYADTEKLTKDEIEKVFNEYKDSDSKEYYTKEILRKDGLNLYNLCDYATKLNGDNIAPLTAKYILNLSKKQFVNKSKIPKCNDGWRIHPLPLLTVQKETVGRGGGDFFIDSSKNQGTTDLIGVWEGDLITLVSKKSDIPKDFIELNFNLIE